MTPITPRNILRHELIGLEVEVVDDSNPYNIGISGRVVDHLHLQSYEFMP